MQVTIKNLRNEDVGTLELADSVFAVPVREDILHRVINWQLAKRRAGTHKVKERGETSHSTAKIYRQKGTGRARHGNRAAVQFRGGGVVHGPRVRDHGFDLPKKVRKLGLKTALAAKQRAGKLIVLDGLAVETAKTKDLATRLKGFGWPSVLFIDGPNLDANFERAARNLVGVDVLPHQGANVYDIIRRDALVLTRAAVEHLEARLK
ncbi:MAG: 50S ribosomal protein L4 [Alphaproteobacteria bacterium]|nr:50S ribosomal protein L4 [Alphaproteobacteria bacterium]